MAAATVDFRRPHPEMNRGELLRIAVVTGEATLRRRAQEQAGEAGGMGCMAGTAAVSRMDSIYIMPDLITKEISII